MHPVRRRKKRPNYGVRTIEVCRGKNGFGFTISGQQPCILSCIVSGSPAERAGLRAGDYLIAVNGQSVGKLPHDDVVRLIGSSSGILKLQIAENYYSDSSDEDLVGAAARSKPKYVHKPRTCTGGNRVSGTSARSGQSADAFYERLDVEGEVSSPSREAWEVPALPPPRLGNQAIRNQPPDSKFKCCFILGYLGTIEMPKRIQPGCRSQVVRGCIKRLRAEKRSHAWVRMKIHSKGVTLAGSGGKILAEYPADRITFCGPGSEEDEKYLGLVTTATGVDDGDSTASSSCHVFAVQVNAREHHKHAAKASSFQVVCQSGDDSCPEFPATSGPVVSAVSRFNPPLKMEARKSDQDFPVPDSPWASRAGSTAASSNSDSGIGFRDDCGNQSDRIVTVDIENRRLHIRQLREDSKNFSVRSVADSRKGFVCSGPSCVLPFVREASGGSNIRSFADPNATVSNRSRSPLDSPGPSSDDDAETAGKHDHRSESFFGRSKRSRSGFAFSRSFFDDDDSLNSLPSFRHLRDRSIFYRLGLLPDRSSDRDSGRIDPNKSADNLMQVGDDSLEKSCGKEDSLEAKSDPYDSSRLNQDSVLVKRNHCKSEGDIVGICTYKSDDALLSYRSSPKVFRPTATQSLENLKGSENVSAVSTTVSLQDFRTFSDGTFSSSHLQKDKAFEEKRIYQEDNSNDTEGVVSWSTSFEKLLEDPSGLQTFAEFLKKEFSQENIIFWTSCEEYRKCEEESKRRKLASRIFETHLAGGATEPVNVDAHAHQSTQEKLSEAPADLFLPAQKQIFNLMKFDSYPRFIKSNLYKECLLRELSGEDGDGDGGNIGGSPSSDNNSQNFQGENPSNRGKLKKSRSDAEDCRRKSLLPWHRKNRSKSKDRGESEYKLSTLDPKRENEDVVSVRSEITSSRSSLASWDLALRGSFSRQSITSAGDVSERENCFLCRVILADGATTVVQVGQNETVRELIHRLLEKRGLQYSSFEVYVAGSPKPLPLDEEASTLGNKEVRVEQRVVFRLDLPNRKTVSVKAKATKTLGQVLRSILHKYSYRPESVTVCSMSENEVLEFDIPISVVDGKRLTVLTRSTETRRGTTTATASDFKSYVKAAPTLDEITNKVFEQVLQGKSEVLPNPADQRSTKSEEWGSDHSSGIFGKFLRRDSAFHEKTRSKSRGGGTGKQILEGASKHVEGVVSMMVTGKPPLIGKWKPAAAAAAKIAGKSESDELYEGLKRAQKSRLEDQRGTEINFELPDFLKDKTDSEIGKKVRKTKREEGLPNGQKFLDGTRLEDQVNKSIFTIPLNDKPGRDSRSVSPKPSVEKSRKPIVDNSCQSRKISEEHCFNSSRTVSKPLTCKTYETPKTTAIGSDNNLEDGLELDQSSERLLQVARDVQDENRVSPRSPRKSDPPPLPPKPKYLPQKSGFWNGGGSADYASRAPQEITNRNVDFLKPSDVKRMVRTRRAIYLDQPTSSFV